MLRPVRKIATTEFTDGRRRRCRMSPADAVAGYRGQLCRMRLTERKEPKQPRVHDQRLA